MFVLIPYFYDKYYKAPDNTPHLVNNFETNCNRSICPPGTSVRIKGKVSGNLEISTSENKKYSAENLSGITFFVMEQDAESNAKIAKLQAPGGAIYFIPWDLLNKKIN